MHEEWFIDGFNVLHALGTSARKLTLNDLLAKISSFASLERKLLIVLDGSGNPDEFRSYRTGHLDVVFAGKLSADSVIEKSLYTARGRAHLVAVTQDRAISQIALGVGARVLTPKDFWKRLEEDQKEKKNLLYRHEVKAHGFNRPFDKKLK